MELESSEPYPQRSGHNYLQVIVQDHARPILGDVHYHGAPSQYSRENDKIKSFGLCLGQAPQIHPHAFKGREKELAELQNWLLPAKHPKRQCIVSIVGLGGMGKTQLSLAYARECGDSYSSVFWINAKDEASLKHDTANLSTIIFPGLVYNSVEHKDFEKKQLERVRQWLSEPENHDWLLIYDNYDDPKLPGIRSETGYDIRPFFPALSHGSILITTRSTKLAFSQQLPLGKLENVSTSVSILSQRAGRSLSNDQHAFDLARRLHGLPLALAGAGNFLAAANISCLEYLDLYESMWTDLFGIDSEELYEYPERTLSSTWTLSLNHVRAQNEGAVQLLKFLAFLNPQDISYELVKAASYCGIPWLREVTQSIIHFTKAMSKLRDYSLVDSVAGSYQVHPCLHDWLVESLPDPLPESLFVAAVSCASDQMSFETESRSWAQFRRLLAHVEQLEKSRIVSGWTAYSSNKNVIQAADIIAHAAARFNQKSLAERMCLRALAGSEQKWGADHVRTLSTKYMLGEIYANQIKFDAAEEIFSCALADSERTLGRDHPISLSIGHRLGSLYGNRDEHDLAEERLLQVLFSYERIYGDDNKKTLKIFNSLGILYCDQNKLDKAEQYFLRVLTREGISGHYDETMLVAVANLGLVYSNQGKLFEADQMHKQAIEYSTQLYKGTVTPIRVLWSFSRSLAFSIRAALPNRSLMLSRLAYFIRFVQGLDIGEFWMGSWLGRALILVNDDTNAQAAFCLCARTAAGRYLDFDSISCDGCNQHISLDVSLDFVGFHICKQCFNIDLCDNCMAAYLKNTPILANCSGHSFFHFDYITTSQELSHFDGDTNPPFDAWVARIARQYGISSQDEPK